MPCACAAHLTHQVCCTPAQRLAGVVVHPRLCMDVTAEQYWKHDVDVRKEWAEAGLQHLRYRNGTRKPQFLPMHEAVAAAKAAEPTWQVRLHAATHRIAQHALHTQCNGDTTLPNRSACAAPLC